MSLPVSPYVMFVQDLACFTLNHCAYQLYLIQASVSRLPDLNCGLTTAEHIECKAEMSIRDAKS